MLRAVVVGSPASASSGCPKILPSATLLGRTASQARLLHVEIHYRWVCFARPLRSIHACKEGRGRPLTRVKRSTTIVCRAGYHISSHKERTAPFLVIL